MSKWYKVTTVCQVLTDYYVWADSDIKARQRMWEQEAMLEDDEYGFINEQVFDVEEV
jgi:hypothetical protein|tara:strand:+ start:1762 stop:1932 length:171 start_codon:yes stop_codon:yes gene_type:complete